MSQAVKKTIVIRIAPGGIQVNDQVQFPWEQTNWPPADTFQINPRLEIYWLCEMLRYNAESKTLDITVLDYHSPEKTRFYHQPMKKPLNRINFESLQADKLKAVLIYYDEKIDQICEAFNFKGFVNESSALTYGEELVHTHDPQVKTSISVAWTEITIRQGCMTILYTPKGFSQAIEVVIYNNNLLAPFENIKPFFKRHLGKSKVKLDVVFEISNGLPRFLYANSTDLEAIDTECVQAVKAMQMDQLKRTSPKKLLIDKSLFTPDEFFEEVDDSLKGNVFQLSDAELLEQLLDLKPSRNRKQIEYLATHCHDEKNSVMFSLQPQFGFLFSYTGVHQVHYIWELLNSHATYVWSYPKDNTHLPDHRTHVQQQVDAVRKHGREVYKAALSDDQPFDFHLLAHGTQNASVVDAFPKWKHRLLSLLR